LGFAQAVAQAESVRPEVGKHLKDAAGFIKAGKYKEALAKLRDAEGVANRTPAENNAIEGTRFSAAMGASDADSMVKAYDVLKARLGGPQQLQYMEAIAGTYLRAGNAAKALEWANKYFAAGGNSATMKTVQQQAQFKSGDMGAVLKDTLAEIQAEEKAGKAPTQDKLNLLLYAAQKKNDGAAEALATEKLLNYYPRKELWAQILGGLPSKKGFSPRFSLDVYRLQLVVQNDARLRIEDIRVRLLAFPGQVVEDEVVFQRLAPGLAEGFHHRLHGLHLFEVGLRVVGGHALKALLPGLCGLFDKVRGVNCRGRLIGHGQTANCCF
ncbi:MAG: hypothetical protein DI585_05210, partial [Pseudomonas fluorescens]